MANVPSNVLNTIAGTIQFQNVNPGSDDALAQSIFDSVVANNPIGASGGDDGDSVEELRENSLGSYGAQLRAVTQED